MSRLIEKPVNLALTNEQLALVKEILQSLVPGREVWAFGSRVHGRTLKRFSDLDLCIMGDERLLPGTLSQLDEAFDESLLPYKVDVLDWNGTDERFRKVIEREYVVLLPEPSRLKGDPHAP